MDRMDWGEEIKKTRIWTRQRRVFLERVALVPS
jgi:hypothetical protein